MSENNKKNLNTDLYKSAQESMLEKEWDEIFKTLNVEKEEYKIFLSAGTKVDDSDPLPRPPKK